MKGFLCLRVNFQEGLFYLFIYLFFFLGGAYYQNFTVSVCALASKLQKWFNQLEVDKYVFCVEFISGFEH